MEIKTGKWKRSPYRMLRYGGLLFITVLLAVNFGSLYRKETGKEVRIVSPYVAAGETIHLEWTRIRSSEVKSCVWYVGGKEKEKEKHFCSYTPEEADAEQEIRVRVTLKDGQVLEDSKYFSVLPVLYLDSDTAYDEVTKEEDASVKIRLESGEYEPEELYRGSGRIHLRGNSTAQLPKHPFKLQLEEKTGLLGMGKSRHWVLLANAIDATLLRNQLVYELSGRMGTECYMSSRQVTLIYNGEYCGVYQLCEQIRISGSRVPIYSWEDQAERFAKAIAQKLAEKTEDGYQYQQVWELTLKEELKADLSWLDTGSFSSKVLAEWNETRGTAYPTEFQAADYIDWDALPERTGGVLLELDSHEGSEGMETAYRQPLHFVSPVAGETCETLASQIRTSIQSLEYAFHGTDFTYHADEIHYRNVNEGICNYEGDFAREGVTYEEADYTDVTYDGYHYSELMDMDSLVNNFLLCEFTANWDAMKNSVYLYKDIEGLWYLSPAWDYDWAWGNSMYTLNTWYTDEWQTTSNYYANETYYQTVQWNRYLIRDPYFLMKVQEKYQEIRDSILEELVQDGGVIDQYAEALRPAALANDIRWGGSMGTYEGQTFDEGIGELKRFMKERLAWMDEQFTDVETLRNSLGYYVTSELLELAEEDGSIHITSKVPDAAAVSLQVNGLWLYQTELTDGEAVFEIPDSVLQSGKNNCVQARLVGDDGSWILNLEGTVKGDYENAISSYICFVKNQ